MKNGGHKKASENNDISKLGGALSLGKIGTKIISRLGGTATRLAGNAFVQTAVKIAGNAVSEGIEEYLQTHLEKMFRNIAFYEDNEIDPFDEEAIYSGVLGMITGGLLESLGTIRGTNKYKQLGAELTAKGLKAGIVDAAINSEMEAASLARLLKDGKIRGIGNEAYTLGRIAEEFMQADAEGWKRITSGEQINKSSYKDGIHTRGFDFDKAKAWYELHTAESMTDDQTDAEVKAQMADGYGLSDAETERIYYNEVLSESQMDTLDGLKQQGVEISAKEFFEISSAKALKDEYGDNISGSKEAAKAEAINELGLGFADAGKVAEAVGLDEKDLYSAYEQGETPETKKAVIEACTAAGMSEEAAKNFYKQIKSAAKPEKMRLITENKALNEQQKAKAAAAAFTSDKEKAVYELAVSTGAMESKLMKVYAEFKMEETGKGENLSREEMKSFLAKKGLNVWQVNTVYLLEASDKKEYNRRLNVMLQKAQMSADKKMEIKGVLWRK